jgi:hypothetical protein
VKAAARTIRAPKMPDLLQVAGYTRRWIGGFMRNGRCTSCSPQPCSDACGVEKHFNALDRAIRRARRARV